MVLFSAILLDTGSRRSTIRRAIDHYLTYRWSRAVGIDAGDERPLYAKPLVDDLVGDLPLPPKAMKVVRGDDLRNLGRVPEGESASEVSGASTATEGTSGGSESGEEGPYARQMRHLLREVRTFAACNLGLLFLAALLVVKSRSGAAYGLVPAALLAVSTVLSLVTYFAARDWFWSFLSGDHAGVGYLVFVGSVATLLADILWNQARIVKAVLRLFWWIPV